MIAFVFVLVGTTPFLGLTARVKTLRPSEDFVPGDDLCPDGFTCSPAPCEVDNSNGLPGRACACADGFIGSISWQAGVAEGSCSPAPCNIHGTIGDGPSCQCMPGLSGDITWSGAIPTGDCVAEAKALFTHGADNFWERNGKMIKCCASSAGKETQLQDMEAETLPSFGRMGRSNSKGCGYMFGDTYHNGLGSKMSEPTCRVAIAKLMSVSGSTFDEVASLLGLEVSEDQSLMEKSMSKEEVEIANTIDSVDKTDKVWAEWWIFGGSGGGGSSGRDRGVKCGSRTCSSDKQCCTHPTMGMKYCAVQGQRDCNCYPNCRGY